MLLCYWKVEINFIFECLSVADEGERGTQNVGPNMSPVTTTPPKKKEDATSSPDQNSANTTLSSRETVTPPTADVSMETESAIASEKPKVVGSKEARTVFVSNLAMSTTEERLREKFSEVHVHPGPLPRPPPLTLPIPSHSHV